MQDVHALVACGKALSAARWAVMTEHRAVALEALRHYDLVPQRVRLAAESFNSIFQVTTASAVYALRVGAVLQIHPEGTAAVEAAWHRRLRQHGMLVPDVLANADGEPATLVADDRAEHGTRVCVVFDWVTGRSLRSGMSGRRAAALGRLSARLQQDGAAWSPPGAAEVLRADRVLYWQVPDQLAAAGPRFGFGTLFTDAQARAQAVLDSLWQSPPHPPHLVHGDLTPQNVIVSPRNGLVPIDFQDTVLGFEVQDLAITISALRRWPGSDRLIDAFRAGYGEHRAWPDVAPALFDSLIAARGLQQLNLTMNLAGGNELDSYLASHAGRVRTWMRSPAGL
jgi:Ser/Thr protein kinase RdoA (MazF antagonist)